MAKKRSGTAGIKQKRVMMNRPLLTGERIMYADPETTINCVFPVTIQGTIEMDALRIAMQKLQQRHPALQAVVRENKRGVPSFYPGTGAGVCLDLQTRETDADWKKRMTDEWHRPFDREKGPLFRVIWIKSPAISELLFVCPHFIVDGRSSQTLLSELLEYLDKPDKAPMPYPSFQNLQELLPGMRLSSPGNILKGKLIAGLARTYFFLKRPKQAPESGKGTHYLLHWKLEKATSTALMSYSRQQQCSIYTLCITAFLEAFQQVLGERDAKGQVICPVDIRRYLPAIGDDHLFAFAPITELSIRKMAALSFEEKSKALRKQLQANVEKINIQSVLVASESLHAVLPKMIRHMRSSRGSHDITFSNMGKLQIPTQFDRFSVKSVYSPTVAFPWQNPNTLVLSSYADQLDFAFISREDFLSQANAQAIKEIAMQSLLQALEGRK